MYPIAWDHQKICKTPEDKEYKNFIIQTLIH
jgi:hypothetical protein